MVLFSYYDPWWIFCLWLFPAVASSHSLPNSTVQFIQDAFQQSVRTLYLVNLGGREWFESFLQSMQPFPKVILDSNQSIESLDESCMVVLYMDVKTYERINHAFEMYFNIYPQKWNAKLLVLVDDKYLNHPNVLSVLELYFKHLSIVFWCMTGERYGTTMKYSVTFASGTVAVTAPLNVQAYSYRRFLHLLHYLPVIGQVLSTYPYTFVDDFKNLSGIDYTIFASLGDYTRIHLKFLHLYGKMMDAAVVQQMASDNLIKRTVDFTLTRLAVNNEFLPTIVLPETMDICLVVPRKLYTNHFEILLRPFSNTLWIMIACSIGLTQIVLYLAKGNTRLGRWLRGTFGRPPMQTFLQITSEVLVFVLIESYLAQVTSYLLVHRFQRDPATLEEFFATGIPVRYTDQQKRIFATIDANLSERFEERAVPETICAPFSDACAHLDTVEHATFYIGHELANDPITGRKPSFILPETLNRLPAQYIFARGATPLRDYFALHLNWLRAFGYMDGSRRPYDNFMEANRKRYVITEELIQMKHLVPFWIFLIIGWSISATVFVGERCIGTVARLKRRART